MRASVKTGELMTLPCITCGDDFQWESKPGGRPAHCSVECRRDRIRARAREWRRAAQAKGHALYVPSADEVANNRLRRKYGVTLSEYQAMRDRQGGLCAICRAEPHPLPGRAYLLVVDHCHTTGRVRGLLCGHCNTMLGYARDRTKTLLAAVRYLERAS